MNQKETATPFEILDHPADIGIRATGNSLEELFINASSGITYLISEIKQADNYSKEKINIEADNLEELFTNYLDEILYLFDANGFITVGVEQIKIDKPLSSKRVILNAIINCQKFNKEIHEIKLYLKAVTHHQLKIEQLKNGKWEAVVYFDV